MQNIKKYSGLSDVIRNRFYEFFTDLNSISQPNLGYECSL